MLKVLYNRYVISDFKSFSVKFLEFDYLEFEEKIITINDPLAKGCSWKRNVQHQKAFIAWVQTQYWKDDMKSYLLEM